MTGKITITNKSPEVAVIDIDGVIGVPEDKQFEDPGKRVATYEKFRKVVETLKEVDTPEIIVNIRSTGGNVNDALLIFDAMAGLDARITTKCFGYVASAATIIAQAASPGCREISSNSLYLIHRSVCSAKGNAAEISRSVDMLGKTDQRIAAIYAARSGKQAEQFLKLMEENNGNGKWLSPEETIEYALADKITAGAPIAPGAAESVKNYGLPPIPEQKKPDIMNITRRWNSVLEKLGLISPEPEEEENQMAEAAVTEVLPDREETNEMVKAYAELNEKYEKEIDELRNQISLLEAQNARLAVMPTMTKPKEDPSAHEMKRSANESAYYEDLRGFNI